MWTATIALGIAAAGIVAGTLAAVATRRIAVGIPVMVDLWTAGGLLKLSADTTWSAIAIAALVVALRKLVVMGLSATPRDGSPGEPYQLDRPAPGGLQ